MSTRNWHMRLEDILEAICAIEEYTAGMDYSQWQQDRKTIDAVIRNLLIHEYFGVDIEVIWRTIQEDLGKLKETLLKGVKKSIFGTSSWGPRAVYG